MVSPVGFRPGRWRQLLGVLVLSALTGCGTIEAAKERGVDAVRKGADILLEDGITLVCDAPTAGSLRRRWGSDQAAVDAWKKFCDVARSAPTVAP